MKLSHFFIDHPRFATVVNIFIVVFGLATAAFLPVAQYPNIVPPTVQITTAYPGASAETIARTVATPSSEIYPHISQDTVGLRRLFRQFSAPGGIPSHASVQTPGSINSHKGFLSESELQETSDSPKDWPDSYCCGTAKSFADAGGASPKNPGAER
jgi:hypothetical protein